MGHRAANTEAAPATPFEFAFLDMRYVHPVRFRGRTFPSAENAYQSARFSDPAVIDKFQYMPPDTAAYRGATLKGRSDGWEDAKEAVLNEVLRAKFSDRKMREMLRKVPEGARIAMRNVRHENDLGACQCPLCQGRGRDLAGVAMTCLVEDMRRRKAL